MSAPSAWAEAAARIARAVERRERAGALLQRFGAGALAGGLAGLAAGWVGAPSAVGWAAVAGGVLGGLVLGVRAARQVPPVNREDAAWALDRVAGAGEAGLAESAGGTRAQAPPPRVRLLPLRGLPLAVGGALVAGLACVRPGMASDDAATGAGPGSPGEVPTRVVGTIDAPAEVERQAGVAAEAARVRIALGLPAAGDLAPEALAAALRDEAALRAAREAADAGSALAGALADPTAAEAQVARGLAQGAEAALAVEAARRADVALGLDPTAGSVPAGRRALVARYMARVRAAEVPR